jgi:hypothetical protein
LEVAAMVVEGDLQEDGLSHVFEADTSGTPFGRCPERSR